MEKMLKLDGSALGIPSIKMINPEFMVFLWCVDSDRFELFVLHIHFFPGFVKKSDHGFWFAPFSLAESDKEIAVPQNRAASLIEPQLAPDPADIELFYPFQLSRLKKNDTATLSCLRVDRFYEGKKNNA
jgi:hypothetical protein